MNTNSHYQSFKTS